VGPCLGGATSSELALPAPSVSPPVRVRGDHLISGTEHDAAVLFAAVHTQIGRQLPRRTRMAQNTVSTTCEWSSCPQLTILPLFGGMAKGDSIADPHAPMREN